MRNKTVLLIFMTSILAIILVSCGGVKVNRKVVVKDQEDYSVTIDSGTYTYRIFLEPRRGPISSTSLGITTKSSKLILLRNDFPKDMPLTPGEQPKPIVNRIGSFDIKDGVKYVKDDTVGEPDGSTTTFEITIDIATDMENVGAVSNIFYLVDFKVNKQT